MLIGVDWGTTRMRAYLIGDDGWPVAGTESEAGMAKVPAGGFEAALERAVGPWRTEAPDAPILMAGMVGARQGWVEAPYVAPPASLEALAAACVAVQTAHLGMVRIVPGVAVGQTGEAWADVMRGEETQVVGATAALDLRGGTFVLPGTHAKWVRVEEGAITHFQTYMTGEVFAALRDHTILSRMLDPAADDPAAFAEGLAAGQSLKRPGDLLTRLFTVRAEGLMGRLGADEAASFLSGLLIGAEVAAATSEAGEVIVVGASGLAQRYRTALAAAGVTARLAPADVAAHGLAQIAAHLPRD